MPKPLDHIDAHLTTPRDEGGAGFSRLTGDTPTASDTPHDFYGIGLVLPAGDLNGDGFDDILIEYDWPDEDHLVARSGRTGDVLYSVAPPQPAIDPMYVPFTGASTYDDVYVDAGLDATGDGIGDVFFIAISGVSLNNAAYLSRFAYLVQVFDGATGTEVATYSDEGTRDVVSGIDRFERYPSDFHVISGADGLADVTVQILDGLATRFSALHTGSGTSTLLQIDGANGAATTRLQSDLSDGEPRIYEAGDLNDDGRDEILVSVITQGQNLITAHTVGGDELWTATIGWWGVFLDHVIPLGGGDPDLVFSNHVFGGPEPPLQTFALDGATGAQLWASPEGWLEFVPDVDRDGGMDIADATGSGIATVTYTSGADLTPITERTYRISDVTQDSWTSISCCWGDLDGDGVPDPVLSQHIDDDTPWSAGYTVAISGATLQPLWPSPRPALGYPYPIGDLDGDGGDDLYFPDSFVFKRGADLAQLATIPNTLDYLLEFAWAADLSPDRGNEIVLLLQGEMRLVIQAYTLDAELLWQTEY